MPLMKRQGFKNYEKLRKQQNYEQLEDQQKEQSEFKKLHDFYQENIYQTRMISKIIAYIWQKMNDGNDERYNNNKKEKPLYIQAMQWFLYPTSDEDESEKEDEDEDQKNILKLPSLAKLMYAPLPNDEQYQDDKYKFFNEGEGKRYSEFLEQVVLSCMTDKIKRTYLKKSIQECLEDNKSIQECLEDNKSIQECLEDNKSIQDLLDEMKLKIPIFPFDTGNEWLFETNIDTFDGYLKDPDPNHSNIYTVVIAFPPRPHFCTTTEGKTRLNEWLQNDEPNVSHHPYIPNCSC